MINFMQPCWQGTKVSGSLKKEFRKDPAAMSLKEQLIQGLSEAGCSKESTERIDMLCEAGSYDEMLHPDRTKKGAFSQPLYSSS